MIVSLIVAMGENRVIGRENGLPWELPEDLKRFKRLTLGHPIIMGRKTFESIGRVLPERENIIVTRQKDFKVAGATVRHSLEEALEPFRQSDQEVFVIGGGEIFSEALPLAQRIYLTLIEDEFEGDAFFPAVDFSQYKIKAEESFEEPLPFKFINYEKS